MKFPVLKSLLSRLGVLVPTKLIHYLNGILNYLHVGRWMHDRGFTVPPRARDREDFYRAVRRQLDEPLTYLEFGVFDGTSMRRWSKLLTHRDTTLTGFDSFEGLPENWGLVCTRETFDVEGNMPRIDDPRVTFVKGWFSDTLPPRLAAFAPHARLLVHLDADVYSSTRSVLTQLRPWLRASTVLMFDEFFDREHELKAFEEFLVDTGTMVKCIAATSALTQVAFEVTTAPAA